MSFRALRRDQSNRRPKPLAAERSLGARFLGLAIVGVGTVLAADAIARRFESAGPSAAVDGVRKRRGRATPRGPPSDGIDDDRLNADRTEDRRSAEAIDGRATANVQEEPASPGELTLDEDLAEELREDERGT